MDSFIDPALALLLADRIGVFVFAISGAIVAVRRNMDLLGVIVLGFLPAVGGGTLRDLVLDQPVFWLEDGTALAAALAGALATFFFHRVLEVSRPLRWADALGMALFCVAGAAKAHALGFGPWVAVIMGAVTASAGGLLRDVVAQQEPLLLKQDIYATAALLGAAIYVALEPVSPVAAGLAGFSAAFGLRAAAVLLNWQLPKPPR